MTTIYETYKQRIQEATDPDLLTEDLGSWARHIQDIAPIEHTINQGLEATRQTQNLEALATLLKNQTPQEALQEILEHVIQYTDPWG